MTSKISLIMLTFLFCLTMRGQNAGQIDVPFQPNGTQTQSLSFKLVENTLYVKGSMNVHDAQAEGIAYRFQADSVYLKVIYKKEVNTDAFFASDVDFSIPGCKEDSYIVLYDPATEGYSITNFCTKVIRSSLSVTYKIGEKRETQDLEYSLNDNKLNIKGYLFTNCCGHHSLICNIVANEIIIERYDAEPLCDCEGAHLVDISISGCELPSYNVRLLPYMDYLPETGENVVVNDPSGITTVKTECDFIKYENGYCYVDFPNPDASIVWTIDIFDLTGNKLLTKESNSSKLMFSCSDLPPKVYICQITCDTSVYIQKLVIH